MAYFQTDNLWVNRLADGVADLVLDVADSDTNELSPTVLADIAAALDRVENDAAFRLLLVRTSKTTSYATGLAPRTLYALTTRQLTEFSATGQALCRRISQLRLPVMALISGACLGAGLELALACDYRVAVDKSSTKLAFSDLELGLMPTWGGTYRVIRQVGIERGLQMLLGARRLTPATAKAWGAIDTVVPEGSQPPPTLLKSASKSTGRGLRRRTLRQKLSEGTPLGRWLIFRGADRLLRRRLPDDMPAPWEALAAVRVGLRQGEEAALAFERSAAERLFESEACRNLLRLHVERDRFRVAWDENQAAKAIGIIGDGERALALTHMAVSKGFQVIIRATDEGALGLTLMRMLALFRDDAARGALTAADFSQKLANVKGTTAWKGFEGVDIVLEASQGASDTVRRLFRELEHETPKEALLATTDLTVSVSELQAGASLPERIAGLSFMAPVSRSLLVEVIASDKTDTGSASRLSDLVARLGRTPWPVRDQPGLLIERLFIPYLHEAITLVKEGMALPRLDEAMAQFGVAHGPFEYADLMGIDTAAALTEQIAPDLAPHFHFDGTLAFMAGKRWLGHKTRLGFYHHQGKKKKPNKYLMNHLRAAYVDPERQMEALSRADQLGRARQRLVLMMINEAAWCLEEGRAESAEALDLALMLAGWAPHRGGPLHYARHVGLEAVIGELTELAGRFGPRFEPCPRLRELVK